MIVVVIVAVTLVAGLIVSIPRVPFGAVLSPLVVAFFVLVVTYHPTRRQLLEAAGVLVAVLVAYSAMGGKWR